MSTILIAIIMLFAPTATVAAKCDTVEGPNHRWTKAERDQTFVSVQEVCDHVGASDDVCKALAAVTWRESRGVASLRHTRGKGELGFGAHGIGWKYYRKKIKDAKPDDFCDARQSALAVLSIWQRFVMRGAKSWIEIQRGYGGRKFGSKSRPKADRRWCNLLGRYDVDCKTGPSLDDLGVYITPGAVRSIAADSRKKDDTT